MTQSEFLKRWIMHYVHPEYFYIPWSDHKVGTVTLNLTLTGSPVADVPNCLCSFYIYHVETDEYMQFNPYGNWYVGTPMTISGESGDVVVIDPCMTDKSGEITLRLPFGTYQYIEYECVYGKIKKQPIQFTVDGTERTVTIAHQAAYLHESIGDEVIITTRANVIKEEDYDYDGESAYFQPSQTVDFIGYTMWWSQDLYADVASASDNTDRPYWNYGQTTVKPTGHVETHTDRYFYKNNFDTTMDWDVTCTQTFQDEAGAWGESIKVYGSVEFRINENNYCERYLTFKKQTRYEEHPAMFWEVNGDRQYDYFHDLNPAIRLFYDDDIETREFRISYLNGDYITNSGKRGEKRYDVLYENTGELITYQETCIPAYQQQGTVEGETYYYSEPQVDTTEVESTTGGYFTPYWWKGVTVNANIAVWCYMSDGVTEHSMTSSKPVPEDNGRYMDYNYTVRGRQRLPMTFYINFTDEEIAANVPSKNWKNRINNYMYVRQQMANKIQVTIE